MELIDAFPLRQAEVTDPAKLYKTLMELILKFASQGLIHGDFNEFNILLHEESQEPVVIDFPQMISINHRNAEEQFNRDVECIRSFFQKKFRYTADDAGPFWSDVKRVGTLDAAVEASGISKKQAKELEKYMREVAPLETNDDDNDEEEGGEEEDEDEKDDNDDDDDDGKDTIHGSDDEQESKQKK